MWGGRENKTRENKTRVSRSPHITILEPVYIYTGYKEAQVGLYRKRRRGGGGVEGRNRAFGLFSFERVSRKNKTKTNIEKKNKQKQAVNLPYSGRTVKSLSFGTFVTN